MSLDHRRAPGMRKARRRAVREGARSARSTLQCEPRHRLRRRVREAKGSARRARDSGGTSAMRYWDLHAMFPRETRETRRVRVSRTTKAGDRKRPRADACRRREICDTLEGVSTASSRSGHQRDDPGARHSLRAIRGVQLSHLDAIVARWPENWMVRRASRGRECEARRRVARTAP